jgi:hypothetical protein
MDNTDIKIISATNYEAIATTQATSNCKQTPD